jgi:hypothetical protein
VIYCVMVCQCGKCIHRWIFFFRDMVGGFGSVCCIKRMFYRTFPPLYYVSEIGDGNVQTNVSERKEEEYLLCGVNVETITVSYL